MNLSLPRRKQNLIILASQGDMRSLHKFNIFLFQSLPLPLQRRAKFRQGLGKSGCQEGFLRVIQGCPFKK